jgi:predicted DNA-binding ribbon-helix-helix protein
MDGIPVKTEVTLDAAKYERLERIARERSASVDDLIREAVDVHFGLATRAERLAALEALAGLELPVGSWEEMEAEIVKGATEG